MLVRPLSTVDNTRDYARVSHSRQWSNYNIILRQFLRLRNMSVDTTRAPYRKNGNVVCNSSTETTSYMIVWRVESSDAV